MADSIADVVVKLQTDLSDTKAQLGGVADSVGNLGKVAEAVGGQLDLFANSMAIPYADATGQLNLFTDALEPVAGTAQSAAEAVADLAGAMTDYSPAAQEVINQQKELNAAMEAAAAAVEELSKAHKEGAIDAETLARAQSRLEQATHAAGHAQEEHHGILEKMADGLSQITGLSESAAHSILGFATELLGVKLAGDALEFVLGHLTAIAEESMEAAARFERLSEAMTLMYGSANEASAALEATEEAGSRHGREHEPSTDGHAHAGL